MSDRESGPPEGQSAPGVPEEALAEVTRLARRDPGQLGELLRDVPLKAQAELALRLPAKERMAFLLHSPRPMRLVRSIPDQDLYVTIREIGPVDATGLLRLAGPGQLQHLVDLESWRGQRFDGSRSGGWVALLLEADEKTLSRFLRTADDDLLAMLFRSWIRVSPIEYEDGAEKHGHGVSEVGTETGPVTPDGYYHFSPTVPEHAPAIHRLLQVMYQEFPQRYQQAVWSAQWELPSELEEKALHWRQSRLEEHGFPNWDEALGIYAAPSGDRLHTRPVRPEDPDALPASRAPLMLQDNAGLLAAALDRLDTGAREVVLHELTSVANHVMVADGLDTGNLASHRQALTKTLAHVEMALAARGVGDPSLAGRTLDEVPVMELFREGYARTAELRGELDRLVSRGWPAGDPAALDLLDSPVREQVRALLAPRPLYFPAEADAGAGPREFRNLDEVKQSRVALEMAQLVGRLFVGELDLDVQRVLEAGKAALHAPRFSTVMLTVLAWHATRGELCGDPLPPDVVADFLRNVASRRTAPPEAAERALEKLVRTLTENFALNAREISLLGAFGRFCLGKLAEECSALEPGVPVDPRYVSGLLLKGGDLEP